jgi:hypothetical protein
MPNPVLIIDVAHPPRPPEAVEQALNDALDAVQRSSTLRIIKVVHGYGSSGRGGSTLQTVRNWGYNARKRMREIIPGEEYTIFDSRTQQIRGQVEEFSDEDLGAANRGVTLFWVK